MTRRVVLAMAGLAALLPWSAEAHSLSDRYGSFLGAAMHPLVSLDHGLALLAVGLYAGQNGERGRSSPWVLAAALVIGVAVGQWWPAPSVSGTLLSGFNIGTVLVMGIMIAAAVSVSGRSSLVCLPAAIIGLSHGLENGLDLGIHGSASAALGVALAGLIVAAPIGWLVSRLPPGWPQIGVRVAGSWIAAIGLIMLGFAWRSSSLA